MLKSSIDPMTAVTNECAATCTGGILLPRTGPALIAATRPFEIENWWRSSWALTFAVVMWLGAIAVTMVLPWWPSKLAAGIVAAFFQVRVFIIYHDIIHGAILRGSRTARAVAALIGFFLLAVRSVWDETHDYHHQNNAKLLGSAVGSYPVLTVGMLQRLSLAQRSAYRRVRHPLTIGGGYVTLFLIGMALGPLRRNARRHWLSAVAVLVHLALIALTTCTLGWSAAIFGIVVPYLVAMALGSYLFYAQHNFPSASFASRREWRYADAALLSSSMFDMSPLMHWFTGNIGYHHVHHLNQRIPFYRLPEAMRAIPECQNPGRTSWRLRDMRACMRLHAWSPQLGRMVNRREADNGIGLSS